MNDEANLQKEIQELEKKQKDIEERIKSLGIVHEHIVIINRYDRDTITFLELDEVNREGRRRQSWYGKVLAITGQDSGDDVIETKKKKIKVGDVVIFNPESAYSLNLANFPEVWILHIDSILIVDNNFDYVEMKKENLRRKHSVIAKANDELFRRAQMMQQAKEAKGKGGLIK